MRVCVAGPPNHKQQSHTPRRRPSFTTSVSSLSTCSSDNYLNNGSSEGEKNGVEYARPQQRGRAVQLRSEQAVRVFDGNTTFAAPVERYTPIECRRHDSNQEACESARCILAQGMPGRARVLLSSWNICPLHVTLSFCRETDRQQLRSSWAVVPSQQSGAGCFFVSLGHFSHQLWQSESRRHAGLEAEAEAEGGWQTANSAFFLARCSVPNTTPAHFLSLHHLLGRMSFASCRTCLPRTHKLCSPSAQPPPVDGIARRWYNT